MDGARLLLLLLLRSKLTGRLLHGQRHVRLDEGEPGEHQRCDGAHLHLHRNVSRLPVASSADISRRLAPYAFLHFQNTTASAEVASPNIFTLLNVIMPLSLRVLQQHNILLSMTYDSLLPYSSCWHCLCRFYHSSSSTASYCGVTMNCKLKYNRHISTVVCKATGRAGIILRSFYSKNCHLAE